MAVVVEEYNSYFYFDFVVYLMFFDLMVEEVEVEEEYLNFYFPLMEEEVGVEEVVEAVATDFYFGQLMKEEEVEVVGVEEVVAYLSRLN